MPDESIAIVLWISLGLIAAAALAVGGYVWWLAGSGFIGLATLLVIAAAGLYLVRHA